MGERLEESVTALLDRYLSALWEDSNPLGMVPERWLAARDHARLILLDCARALRSDGAPAPAPQLGPALSPAPRHLPRTRLVDVLRAMSTLTDLTLERLAELVASLPAEERHPALARAAAELNRATALRVQAAAAAHEDQLLRQVEQANTDHRSRLAGEIHDRIGSSLALAFCHLALYRAETAAGRGADDRITALEQSLHEVVRFTQRVVSGLSPDELIEGLDASLRHDASILNLRGVPLRIEVSGDEGRLPARHREELFLVLREFLRNSFAHASPSSVGVAVRILPGRVDADAEDDGLGFDLLHAASASHGGLRTMRRRVTELGGAYLLTSNPGEGTRMRLSVPLPLPSRPPAAAPPPVPAEYAGNR
ncbi:sensor histidine kinase [Actinorugispora endophytica]|uniref:sensor histidine kinase n=1 Tax=Actinorugispora endophytica TaxID=1605990 RepID=UPI00105E5094|nr:ATP-binding protein [Actinorugispora endophytica]